MSEEDSLRIKLASLAGTFIGTMEGILAWEIPEELKTILEERIKRLKEEYENN